MNLQELLADRKKEIVKTWQEKIFQSYPADSRKFLKSKTDMFANPVGFSIKEKTENLFKELMNEADFDPEKVALILDEIIRIRAIQDFSPSQAISFIYMLKDVITDVLNKRAEPDKDILEELITFYNKIDKVAMAAFDIYSKCKEKLFEIKVENAKKQVSGLLRRSDLVSETPEWESS